MAGYKGGKGEKPSPVGPSPYIVVSQYPTLLITGLSILISCLRLVVTGRYGC